MGDGCVNDDIQSGEVLSRLKIISSSSLFLPTGLLGASEAGKIVKSWADRRGLVVGEVLGDVVRKMLEMDGEFEGDVEATGED